MLAFDLLAKSGLSVGLFFESNVWVVHKYSWTCKYKKQVNKASDIIQVLNYFKKLQSSGVLECWAIRKYFHISGTWRETIVQISLANIIVVLCFNIKCLWVLVLWIIWLLTSFAFAVAILLIIYQEQCQPVRLKLSKKVLEKAKEIPASKGFIFPAIRDFLNLMKITQQPHLHYL